MQAWEGTRMTTSSWRPELWTTSCPDHPVRHGFARAAACLWVSRQTGASRKVRAIIVGYLAILWCLAPVVSAQQQRRRGQVNAPSGKAVAGALIRVDATGHTTSSHADGHFIWPGPDSGRWAVTVRAIGFRPLVSFVTVAPDGLLPATLTLTPLVQQLDSLTVGATPEAPTRLREFERRRRNGSGRFFTRDDVERAPGALLVSSLLRFLPSGVRVVDSMGTPLAISNRGSKLVSEDGRYYVVPCVLRTVIDGQLQPWGTSLDVISPNEVAAIEVYLGPSSVPPEFAAGRRDQFCGLLVFWTRSE